MIMTWYIKAQNCCPEKQNSTRWKQYERRRKKEQHDMCYLYLRNVSLKPTIIYDTKLYIAVSYIYLSEVWKVTAREYYLLHIIKYCWKQIRVSEWEWLLFNANSAIFQLYHGESKLIFNKIWMRCALY